MCPSRDTCPGVVYGSLTEVTCAARSNGTRALATCALTAGEVTGAVDLIARVSVSPEARGKCWLSTVWPGVAAVEGVQRGGAELQPQRDEAGDADDPGEQRDPAVPVAGPAEPAKQAGSLAGSRPACGACDELACDMVISREPRSGYRSRFSRSQARGASYPGRHLDGRVLRGRTPPVVRGGVRRRSRRRTPALWPPRYRWEIPAHWPVAVPLTMLTLPLSDGAGLLPEQYSEPSTVLPDTVIAAGAVAVLFSTWAGPLSWLPSRVTPAVSFSRVSVPCCSGR